MKITILNTRIAGPDHAVNTVEGGNRSYRREPCKDCPWKISATGIFPAEAFEHSANTAYDMSRNQFGCHESGAKKPAACAGFLLRGADNNLAIRLARVRGYIEDDVTDGGHTLHNGYRDMAIANGVDPDSPSLEKCR